MMESMREPRQETETLVNNFWTQPIKQVDSVMLVNGGLNIVFQENCDERFRKEREELVEEKETISTQKYPSSSSQNGS